ncbi:MAG: SAM-dependent chlorinase/fluorinase [Chloroflexaceae bacterium]|jgi:hypothetical protein|nr:SAM-dependent chlorinase/fluorinase [Chloroflexaceae bacterium]
MTIPIITLTTDFGTRDSYVGIMKGVILSVCPRVQIVDITHDIAPQAVVQGALLLPTFLDYFPPHAIHVGIVDPGVGSARRPLALATPQGYFVGPDNGLFSLVWRNAQARWPGQVHAVELREARFWLQGVSSTFHGRDIFSPVAAHLANGVSFHELGPTLDAPVLLELPEPVRESAGRLRGEMIYIDHFGNCMSNITTAHLQALGPLDQLLVHIGDQPAAPIRNTYADVAPGAALALIDSNHHLEWAVSNGNASQRFGIVVGTSIVVEQQA